MAESNPFPVEPPPLPHASAWSSDPAARYWIRVTDGQQYGPGTIDTIRQWAREGRVPRDAMLVPVDGGSPVPAGADGVLASITHAPPTVSQGLSRPNARETDSTGGLIPYKNGPALVGYYVSVASLIPLFGLLAAPVAIVLGIMGVRKRLRSPEVRGLAHAWFAIILGSLVFIGHILVIGLIMDDAGLG